MIYIHWTNQCLSVKAHTSIKFSFCMINRDLSWCNLYVRSSFSFVTYMCTHKYTRAHQVKRVCVCVHVCVARGRGQPFPLVYLLPNLANMQVICGVATSQLSHLLSAAPNPLLAAALPSRPTGLHPSSPATLTHPAVTFIASLVCSTCTPTFCEPSNPNNFWQISA